MPAEGAAAGGVSPDPGTGVQAHGLAASLGVTVATALPPALAGAMAAQIIGELGIAHAAFGVAVGAFFLTNAVVSPWAGALADRLGEHRSVQVAVTLSSVSMLGVAACGTSYPMIVAFLLLGGLGAAVGGPAGSILLAGAAGLRWQALLFGVRQAFVPAASLLGGLAVPIFAGAVFGWRIAFLTGGALVILLAFMGRARRPPGKTVGELAGLSPYRLHELWLLAVVFALSGSAANAVTTFVVDYAATAGQSLAFGGMALAMASSAAIVARVAIGYWVGRLRLDSLKVTAVMLVIGIGGFAWIAAGPATAILPGSVLGMAGAWGWSGLLIYAVTFGFGESPGRANGIVQAGGASGGILGPVLTGWTVQTFSYTAAWTLATVLVSLSAVIVVVLLVRRRRREAVRIG